jgi:alanyl-tRNA synthetase
MIKGIPVIAAEFQGDVNAMREEADRLRNQLGSVLVILASGTDGAKLLVAATKDLVGEVHAGNIIRKLAPFIGGGGGGRPDMAQAGGNNVDGIANALQAVPTIVAEMLP